MASTPDLETVKARMKSTWMAGDYGAFAKFMEPGALEILAGWQIPPGARMLDVGCGAGQYLSKGICRFRKSNPHWKAANHGLYRDICPFTRENP